MPTFYHDCSIDSTPFFSRRKQNLLASRPHRPIIQKCNRRPAGCYFQFKSCPSVVLVHAEKALRHSSTFIKSSESNMLLEPSNPDQDQNSSATRFGCSFNIERSRVKSKMSLFGMSDKKASSPYRRTYRNAFVSQGVFPMSFNVSSITLSTTLKCGVCKYSLQVNGVSALYIVKPRHYLSFIRSGSSSNRRSVERFCIIAGCCVDARENEKPVGISVGGLLSDAVC